MGVRLPVTQLPNSRAVVREFFFEDINHSIRLPRLTFIYKDFIMKKIWISLVVLLVSFRSMADEGMWVPILLGQQTYNDMVKKGLKLSKEQLFSMNKASIKDAIVIFGGFCTGEIVSDKGLIFTNHHCGYDAIAEASSVEKNYLKNGFYAKSIQEEIPSEGLYVEFLLKIEDITKQVMDSIGNLDGQDRASKLSSVIASINASKSDPSSSIYARTGSFFKGNQYLLFTYQRYSDIRLVGAPSESIGKYGGDTDNWEWPRHTGDFSVFRVYAGKDGSPAAYSTENTPLKPKHFLPVSIKGVKDGDYAMIFGYPGSTNRYETSLGVKEKTESLNPAIVGLRDMRLKFMMQEMKKDPATRLKLASDYASIANYWKFYDGEAKQLLKYDVYGQKKKFEEKFISWSKGKPGYENIFNDWTKAYDKARLFLKHQVYMNEGIMGSNLMGLAGSMLQVENAIVKSGSSNDIRKAIEAADAARKNFLKSTDLSADQNILAGVLYQYYKNVDRNQHPIGFFQNLKGSFGDPNEEATYKKYAMQIFNNTMLLNDAKWEAFKKNPDGNVLQNDPAFLTAAAFLKSWQSKYLPQVQQFNTINNDLFRNYMKGLMEMDPDAAKLMYPDANFTMRISYGNVKSYQPTDGVKYDHVTTMKGLMQKYKKDDYEFDLPQSFIDAVNKKDFGQYIDKTRNDLVINFITTNDITGGNSGSPVIDANGNLIGLCFDGNYEALSHKLTFDKNLNRTINLDVRYMLWCIEKLGGAKNIIDELKIVK